MRSKRTGGAESLGSDLSVQGLYSGGLGLVRFGYTEASGEGGCRSIAGMSGLPERTLPGHQRLPFLKKKQRQRSKKRDSWTLKQTWGWACGSSR